MKRDSTYHNLKSFVCLLLFVLLLPSSVLADRFSEAHLACIQALGPETEYNVCVDETCAYRACVSAQAVQIMSGELTYGSSTMSTVPAECTPFIQVMQRCINESIKKLAIKYAQPPPLDIGSTWRVVESCPDRKWIATWKLRPGTETFDGTWKQVSGPGSGIPFSDVIDFKSSVNRQVSLYRRSLNGTYTGKLTPDGAKIKGGSASWYYSGCYWTAEISK